MWERGEGGGLQVHQEREPPSRPSCVEFVQAGRFDARSCGPALTQPPGIGSLGYLWLLLHSTCRLDCLALFAGLRGLPGGVLHKCRADGLVRGVCRGAVSERHSAGRLHRLRGRAVRHRRRSAWLETVGIAVVGWYCISSDMRVCAWVVRSSASTIASSTSCCGLVFFLVRFCC